MHVTGRCIRKRRNDIVGYGSGGRIEDDSRKNLCGNICNLLRSYHYHCDGLFVGPDLSPSVAPFPCRIYSRRGLRTEAAWGELLKSSPGIEGVRYQSEVYKILRERFDAARQRWQSLPIKII